MRPKIMPSRSIGKSLAYNETKVTLGKAECLLAANFLKELSHLSLEDKHRCFERRMDLNERVTTSQHITLNFDPTDVLSNEKMAAIATFYMKEIGFAQQPYLVYRHNDAGHPHCHIVTTHIRRDGSPIELYNIGRNQSEKARQLIESEFKLVTTAMKESLRQQRQKINGIRKVIYGKGSTTRSVSDVVEYISQNYKCTSLEEFNVVLRLYNVEAYRGKEGTQLYQHRGLLYRVLDEHGKYIGVPLKASFFDCKPTLDHLEQRFACNQSLKYQHQQHVTSRVRWQFLTHTGDRNELTYGFASNNLCMVVYLDKQGVPKEVNYVDFYNKCVFNGKELGEHCNLAALQKVLDKQKALELEQSLHPSIEPDHSHSLHL